MTTYKEFIVGVYAKPSKFPDVFKEVDGKPVAKRGEIMGKHFRELQDEPKQTTKKTKKTKKSKK